MHTARAGHVHVICHATPFFETTGQPFGQPGSKLGGPLTVGCVIVVAGAEGYKVHVPWGEAINIRGIL